MPTAWVTMINSVIPTSVMPESGDQLVRPIASERMMPAIQIQSVPITAMAMPLSNPMFSTEERFAMVER